MSIKFIDPKTPKTKWFYPIQHEIEKRMQQLNLTSVGTNWQEICKNRYIENITVADNKTGEYFNMTVIANKETRFIGFYKYFAAN